MAVTGLVASSGRGGQAPGRFDDPEAERAFLRQYRAGGLRNLAWAAAIGVLAYTAFAVEHGMRGGWGVFAEPTQLAVMVARLVVATVCLCVLLMIVHAPRRVLEHHVAIMSTAFLLTLVPVALFAPSAEPLQHAHFRSLTGFSITAFALLVLLRLPVWIGASCSLIALSVMVASILAREPWTAGVIGLIFYPAIAVLLGVVVAHVIEHRERALFAVAAGARRLSAEKTRLIGELAHDMRGPLVAISNEVDDLQRQAADLAPVDLARRLAAVEASVLHTRDYLEHLLAWCQAAGSNQPPELGPVDLDEVLLRLKADLTAGAAREGVVLSIERAAGTRQVRLNSNPTELYSILHNLIDNAIKYRDRGSDRRPSVSVRAARHEGRCEIEVADNGIGMDDRALRHIWDVGYRISRLVGVPAGTGLGLPIVKARVERLEGHAIALKSSPGVGTRFLLRVPLVDQPEAFTAELPAADALDALGDDGLGAVDGLQDWIRPASWEDLLRGRPGIGGSSPQSGSGRVLVLGVEAQRWPGLRRRLGPYGDVAEAIHAAVELEPLLAGLSLSFDVILIDGGDDAEIRRLIELVRQDHGYEVPAIVLQGSYRRWIGRGARSAPGRIRYLARLASGERLRRTVSAAIAESLELQRQLLDRVG